jgi:hypothetical protein
VIAICNGADKPGCSTCAGEFVEFTRSWSSGDIINVTIPVSLYTEKIQGEGLRQEL